MTATYYEIRLCQNCGLRYPLTEGHPFGARCPACLGETQVVLKRELGLHLPMNEKPQRSGRISALLDNIRSAWNVGSIFRTADGTGVDKLFLCGITPTPDNEAVRKTSLGAEGVIAWEYSRSALEIVCRLKSAGFRFIALEQDKRAKPLSEYQFPDPDSQRPILIVGNEVTGVDPDILDLCDQILHIPMHGKKRSLNVEVAFAIAAYRLTENNNR